MKQFHFDVPAAARDFLQQSLHANAYISGIEGVPFHSHNRCNGQRLSIIRSVDTSGKLYLPCPIEGLGLRTLSTCSLRPHDTDAYQLFTELARGSCHRARVQSDVWQRAGLVLSDNFQESLARGTDKFIDAAKEKPQSDQSALMAIEALTLLEQAIAELGESYASQSLAFRKEQDQSIGTLLAGTVIPPSPTGSLSGDAFCETFNSAAVRVSWAQIETDSGRFDYDNVENAIRFCSGKGLRIIAGPLIDFREGLMPQWLYLLEDNFDGFLSAARQFVEKTVSRFRGSVQLWNCASGLNTPGPLELSDEQVMRLSVEVLQTVRRLDPTTPAIVSFDQPFGEYLAHHRDAISPFHFADALVRSGLGMAGIGLEFRIGYQSEATLPRSSVEFGQMIDRWATLGMPMLIQLAVPGGKGDDPASLIQNEVLPAAKEGEDLPQRQLRWAGPLIRTLLAKHIVHGVVWDGWSDKDPHVLAHSGLIDSMGARRPLLDYLLRLRTQFLT